MIRLEDLDVICFVLACSPADLLICEPEQVQARTARQDQRKASDGTVVTPRLGRNRSLPPA
jgi:hypothetical protein